MAKTFQRVSQGFMVLSVMLVASAANRAHAYCTSPKICYSLLDAVTCGVRKEIPIYINAGEASIARVGIALDDIEFLTRAAIAAYNEAGLRLPRLVYGGRVFHDTRLVFPPNPSPMQRRVAIEDYRAVWQAETDDPNTPEVDAKPFGITIHANPCLAVLSEEENIDAIAATLECLPITANSFVGFNTITFSAFWDDDQQVCPRVGGQDVVEVNCASNPSEDITVGAPCSEGQTEPCICEYEVGFPEPWGASM